MELSISIACSRFPTQAAVGMGDRETAGMRQMWPQKADDSMDSRQAVVLLVALLLITD